MRIEKLKAELEKAWQKAAEWQARARDLEKQILEQENLQIIAAVRHSFAGGFRGCFRKDQSNERPAGRICR